MTSVKSLQKQLLAAVAMVLVAAIAMSSATYAWFVNNAQVTATNVSVSAAGAYSLLISTTNNASSKWGTTTAMATASGTLTPVSTVGEIYQGTKASGQNYVLASAETDLTGITLTQSNTAPVGIGDGTTVKVGDVRFVTNIGWKDNYVTTVSEVSRSSKVGDNTYFYSDTLYLKAAQEGSIYLDSNGIGIVWAAWDSSKNATGEAALTTLTDFMALQTVSTANLTESSTPKLSVVEAYNEDLTSAQALLSTLRVGLLVTQTGKDANSNVTYTRTWHEYELVNSAINSSNAVNTTLASDSGADGIAKAVSAGQSSSNTASATKTAPYVTTITGAKMGSNQTILTYAAAGSETGLAPYSSTADLLATASANEVVQVDVYIWMEGCDYDTVAANINSFAGAGVTGLQLGFCLGTATSST
jgi:hypothetical protein